MEIPAPQGSRGPQARGYRPAHRWAKAVVCVSKRRALSDKRKQSAHGGRSKISQRGAKQHSEKVSVGCPHQSSWSIPLPYALEPYPWHHKLCHTRLQGVGSTNPLAPLYGVQLSKVREHILVTEQSEGVSYALETKLRNLIDGTTS